MHYNIIGCDIMNVLYGVLKEELERNRANQDAYKEKIALLRKGAIQYRVIKGNKYVYLKYRNGKRVVSEYICSIKNKSKIERLIEELKENERLSRNLRELQEDEVRLRKAVGIYEK